MIDPIGLDRSSIVEVQREIEIELLHALKVDKRAGVRNCRAGKIPCSSPGARCMLGQMATNDNPTGHGPARPFYRWPWFVLAAVLLAIVLAVLWVSREVERMRRLREINQTTAPASLNSPGAPTNSGTAR